HSSDRGLHRAFPPQALRTRRVRRATSTVTDASQRRPARLWCAARVQGHWIALALLAAGCGVLPPAPSPSQPGAIAQEPATLHALGFRWPIVGDHNRNARIDVAYRRAASEDWRAAYPLFRVNPDHVSSYNAVAGGVLFAGSVVDLDPDTAYEVRLTLSDPDGGGEARLVRARTAREPAEPKGLRVRYVVPEREGGKSGTGTRSDPFAGLAPALAAAEAGDVLSLAPGVYRGAPFKLARSGTEQRPIMVRGPVEGEAVLDGGGAAVLIDVSGAHDVWLERLALRNARTLLLAENANRLAIRRNRFEVSEHGFRAERATYDEARGFFITDNVFTGPTSWPRSRGIEYIRGVIVTGSGHVVAYNAFHNLGDGIQNGGDGRLSASDFHNNDVHIATDDGIEADHVDTNVRVYRNRITNTFAAITAQPSYGGPLYVFRNLILNTLYTPFKLHNDTSGVLLFHNTSVRSGIPFHIWPGNETVNDVVTRNNVFVGTGRTALYSTGRMFNCDFDSDGYAWSGDEFASWNGLTYITPLEARKDGEIYGRHGAVTLDAARLFASERVEPGDSRHAYPASANDLRLQPGSGAADRGVPLPNFSDGYTGSAPDLGCCELGAPLPHFGPRARR
ncbi:MAG TPA: right-handed parallel beta-helix repeat-containing protein, partial [Burkholderiales bacterium]|nr:right-handed parallel beta-helix repeat-containing protein [Burkholderiales bacterium]